jgi:hypothetical protein
VNGFHAVVASLGRNRLAALNGFLALECEFIELHGTNGSHRS